jgi:flagellar motor switch protein FliG
MAPNQLSNLDKAAVLLRRLPPPSLTTVLDIVGLEEPSRVRLQAALDAISRRSDIHELDAIVMKEFRDMQRDVKESLRGSPVLERTFEGHGTPHGTGVSGPASINGESSAKSNDAATNGHNASDENDPIKQLINSPPPVIATALQRETLRSMAIVIRELPTEFAGRVLEQLPPEQRQQIFMLLAIKSTIHPTVIQRVLSAVAAVCRTIDEASAGQQDSRFKTLIGILQMVEREERLRLMEALTEQDEELAAQIDDNLYDYTDVLRIQDRSVQKLLTQLELKVVALALKTAPPDIVEKVMKNLSERVRATLNEEMELLSSVSPSKVEQARREIANVVRLQDKDGTLLWIE